MSLKFLKSKFYNFIKLSAFNSSHELYFYRCLESNNIERLKFVLDRGYNPNSLVFGNPLLFHCILKKNLIFFQTLVEYGASLKKNAKLLDFKIPNISSTNMLDFNLFPKIEKEYKKVSLFTISVEFMAPEIVQVFIKHGFSLNKDLEEINFLKDVRGVFAAENQVQFLVSMISLRLTEAIKNNVCAEIDQNYLWMKNFIDSGIDIAPNLAVFSPNLELFVKSRYEKEQIESEIMAKPKKSVKIL